MTVGIVFDSAGTLLKTNRAVKNIKSETLLNDSPETTMLTFEDPDRILVLLNVSSSGMMKIPPEKNLSTYLKEADVVFGISCGRKIIDAECVGTILFSDPVCRVADLQDVIKACWHIVSKEAESFAMNTGVIVNLRTNEIEFTLAAAGYPFPGVREMISMLHQKGVAVYIASGDRTSKLELIADKIGIPRERVYGVATPVTKARIVTSLKNDYDIVVMVGDGINDLSAMRAADVSILTLQQKGERPEALLKQAEYIIDDIRDVTGIVAKFNTDDE
ncbi:Haloacid dehalogenase domain protein hydrolase [Methanocorpusculum labreanum Z]|uniref:Haloacid dehalogenase domain protein hydrolase n=1 Tax=Methanocorpusculum labreanum (strain ATCC 43576 / DSM 4855 / Z) TaxID=410358 RepID=A2SQX4_METLZ|nr:HAD-IC family P-type ATPase [Methanocorpusculum labreanum]ABN06730.1 Haloacid dehalogenase domain protein hydrolase [Methanocorpusculum labreanum Z]